jgi:hypothetical protein
MRGSEDEGTNLIRRRKASEPSIFNKDPENEYEEDGDAAAVDDPFDPDDHDKDW